MTVAEQLVMEISRVRWRAPDGDFAVLEGVTEEGETVRVTGALAHVHEGETVELGGDWREHERFGRQFVVTALRLREPVSENALLGVLSAVKHVGAFGAQVLLDRHGAEVLEIVDADPGARLREIPGIGKRRVPAAVKSWREVRALRALRMFLDANGVPASAASRVAKALGPDAVEVLTQDPYRLTELEGIGFATADALARALGTPPDAPSRLRAGVVHALHEAEADGNCGLPRAELVGRAARLLGSDPDDAIDELDGLGRVVIDGELVCGAALHRTESSLGEHVRRLLDGEPVLKVRRLERPVDGEFVPTDDQWAAVERVVQSRLSILTGGPGVGKTAMMGTLVAVLRPPGRGVKFCARTGRAARRLAESTASKATTIHRLLEWVPGEG